MPIVEGQFRHEAQVLDHEVHLEQETATALVADLPTVRVFAKESVDTALGANTEQNGTLETFVTHAVDFGFLGRFGLVTSICAGVFFVVRKFAVGRAVVRLVVARTLGRGGCSPTFIIIILSHGGHRKCQSHGECNTQSLKIHSLIIIKGHVRSVYKINSRTQNSAEIFVYL